MFAARRLVPFLLFALASMAVVIASRAHAQALSPPDCAIEGVAASCMPELWYGPGPEEDFSYDWTGPNGFVASGRFVDVWDTGAYTLTLTRLADGTASTCSRTFTQLPSEPVCTVTGPDSLCSGQQAELCGPENPYDEYQWVAPDGTYLGASRCVTVSTPGLYTLTVTTGECQSTCTRDVPLSACAPPPPPPPPPAPSPAPDCPQGAGFWAHQCPAAPASGRRFTSDQVGTIAASVDAHSTLFAWPGAVQGFCAALDPDRPMDPRKQARRQFAAFLANLCAGESKTAMRDGRPASLNPGTPVVFDGAATTLGALARSVDARLVQLETARLADPGVRAAYGRIVDALGAMNDGIGLMLTCPRSVPYTESTPVRAAPNPFRAATSISYSVGAGESATLGIYDVSGRLVKQIATNVDVSGVHAVTWDGTDLGGARVRTGVFFVRGRIGGQPVRAHVLMLR